MTTLARTRHVLVVLLGALSLLVGTAASALATDVSIGFLAGGSCADDGTDAISFSISTDRTGPAAEHPEILVEWRPAGTDRDSWSTLATGALTADNGYTFADTVAGLDFTGSTEVEVRATALSSSPWGDGRRAGDTYTSSFAVDACDDPGENARVNFTAGCQNASGEPEILLYNDGVLGVDADVEFVVLAEVAGLTFERTIVLEPEDMAPVALLFTDADGVAFDTEDTTIAVEVRVGDAKEYELDLEVDCLEDGVPTAAIGSTCDDAGQGLVTVAFDNASGAAVTYLVTIGGETVDTLTLAPGTGSTTSYAVTDGSQAVAVTVDGRTLDATTVDLDCQEDDVDVATSVECALDGNVVTVTIDNLGGEVSVLVTVGGAVIGDTTVAAASSNDFSTTVDADGVYEVVVIAGDVTVADEVEVDCAEVLNERLVNDPPVADPAPEVGAGTLANAGFSSLLWLLVALLVTFFGGDLVLTSLYRRWEQAHD